MPVNWDEVDYLELDNGDPPELWAWAGNVGDESSEPLFCCPASWLFWVIQSQRAEISRLKLLVGPVAE